MRISVVIIAKNEARNIAGCIKSAKLLSNDIIVVDSGSNDGTQQIAADAKAVLHLIEWKGYGDARNTGAAKAQNDWIFALDADERISKKLADTIKKLSEPDSKLIYGCRRRNYLGTTLLRFGEWGSDTTYRLYNKNFAEWDDAMVHESLSGEGSEKDMLEGFLEHYTISNLYEFRIKLQQYAQLQAQHFFEQGKKANFFKRFFSPVVGFISGYIFKLGFLDGYMGLQVAKMNAYYTWLKYNLLYKMYKNQNS